MPDIVAAIGLELSDLFPERPTHLRHPTPHRALRSDVFGLIRNETSVVWLIACDMHKDKIISEQDYRRLCDAVAKLERICNSAYGS